MAATARARGRLLVGGILWLTTVQFFVVQAATQYGWAGSRAYSLRRSWISDLGATSCGTYSGGGGIIVCSPRHLLLNIGLVVLGFQVAAGALLLRPLLARTSAADWSQALLVVAGVALPFVAAFPEDTGKPWHAVAATIHLAAAALGTLAAGLALWSAGRRAVALTTLVLGTLALIGTLLTGAGLGSAVGRGGIERLAAWPFTVWTILAGGLVLLGATRVRRS